MANKKDNALAALAHLAARNFQSVNAVLEQEGLSNDDMTAAFHDLQADRGRALIALGAISLSALAIPKVGWVLSLGIGGVAAIVGARATFTGDYSGADRAVLHRAIRNKRARSPATASAPQ